MNVGDWIRKWSLLQPEKKALYVEDRPFTYQEVNHRTNQLCHFLLKMGVKKGDRIAVLLHNCHQYIEIFLGLSKIGAILVPLNWRLAGPELEFILQDSGSRTLILRKRFPPHELLETVQTYRVTLLELAATVFQFILQECDLSQYDLSSVRCFFTGGERIPIAMLKEYSKKGITLSQIFGQTEASTIAFLSPEKAADKIGSVGLPVFHGEVRIVDKMGRDVKPGGVGEIIVKGPTLMSGYWNRPDLTAETLREGWLYTGDLATMDEEGYIYIVDRERDMYISGGENVYPAEIEKIYFTHPKILDAGVVGVPDKKWSEVGKAYIVCKPGETLTEEEALKFLRGKIGKYKIPKYVEFMEELPKTASGKIQKFLLKEGHQKKLQIADCKLQNLKSQI